MQTSTTFAVDWVEANARRSPNKLAQLDLASGRRFSYRDMNERVGRVAGHLTALGVKPGERVGILALNSTDYMEMIMGCWRIGAVALTLNFRLTAPELAFIIKDATPDVVFFDTPLGQVVEGLRAETTVSHWIETDGLGGQSAYEEALKTATPLRSKTLDQPLTDQCMLMYSSGTTGRPKGVIITHEMMVFAAICFVAFASLGGSSVNLAAMPLFHIGGLNCYASPAVYVGATNIIQRTFDPCQTLDVINDEQIGMTHFLGVPAMYNAMKAHPKNAETDFSRLVCTSAGAETVPTALVNWWHDTHGIRIQEGYGMTESAGCSCGLPIEDVPAKVGSAGFAAMHTEMKIAREDGSEADANELGEIWMRGPTITPGYWNRPEADASSFVNGWFRSGDIGRIDPDGYIYIEDRMKDMYISGGENVYPAEIENVLYQLDQIAEVAVIGVADSQWGETGCAVVALKPGAELTMSDIDRFCADKLAKFKRPAHLTFVEALPRNATGKVLKFELRKSVPAQLTLR